MNSIAQSSIYGGQDVYGGQDMGDVDSQSATLVKFKCYVSEL